MRYEQIEPEKWPSGIDRAAAVLAMEPEQIAAAFRVTFDHDTDDLDAFRYAGLRLPSGRQIVLLRYERSPDAGTELLADAGDDVAAAVREFLDAFGLPDEVVTWTPEDVALPRDAAA